MTHNSTRRFFSLSAVVAQSTLVLAAFALPASAVTIPTVPVGNAGNAPDPLTGKLFGSVSYDYRIGTTEVTNAQYAAFLNFKAASDPLALYDASMGSLANGGITRSGSSGSYTYTTKANMDNKPVNFVSWYDAIRFANWLHNGQGSGDTESGAYTILGGTEVPSNSLSINRNAGATWFLTSEDEWYKAAYHQPSAQGGDSDDYWLYPTASNSVPTVATANNVGDISNPGTNVANYTAGADWNGLNGSVTTVGSAGPLSDSFYGTADQGGNLWEWTEAYVVSFDLEYRSLRGGEYSFAALYLQSLEVGYTEPAGTGGNVGFRVATVPEPSTAVLGIVGCALMWGWRKGRK